MNGCTDKRFEEMLHAFEMGMLSDEDHRDFQLHLLDCQHCFEQAQRLASAMELMRDDPDVRAVPHSVVEKQGRMREDASPHRAPGPRGALWSKWLPTTVVAAAIIVILVLQPWQFEIRPTQEAMATENRLAVLYFDNLVDPADPQRLGEITTSLLIADLSESQYLQVVSSQRLYDILRLLGRESVTDRESAVEIARKAGARWMLTGSILQESPRMRISAEVADVESGDVLASQQVTGENGEDVFALVDRLTIRVKNSLSLSVAAQDEPDRRVADVTTHSSLAYRYYLEGLANYRRYYNSEAGQSFRMALAEDSSFAMVYYYLSLIDDPNLIAAAVQHADRARRNERHFILSRQALLGGDVDLAIRELQEVLEDNPDDKVANYLIGVCHASRLEFDRAVGYYNRAVAIDPLYKTAYNQMAYTYNWMGEFQKAIDAINMYISIAPEEANPYDSRGDIYTANGQLELAIASYIQALEIKPDFWPSRYKLGNNNLFLGNYAIADSCYLELIAGGDQTWAPTGWAARAYIPMIRGRFNEAIRLLDDGLAATRTEADGAQVAYFHKLKAIAYEEKGDLDRALIEVRKEIQEYARRFPDNETYNQYSLAHLLAQTGDFAAAEEVTENLLENIRTANDTLRYWYAVASVESAKGNLDEALVGFEKAAVDSVIPYAPANCRLADAYMNAGRWSEAITELYRFLNANFTSSRLQYGGWTPRAHYLIGLAREELGQPDLAAEQYQIFLDLWKNADPGIGEIEDARRRLDRLRGATNR